MAANLITFRQQGAQKRVKISQDFKGGKGKITLSSHRPGALLIVVRASLQAARRCNT